jgi:hypothetical protein
VGLLFVLGVFAAGMGTVRGCQMVRSVQEGFADLRAAERDVRAFREQLSVVDLAALANVKWQALATADIEALVQQHAILWTVIGPQAVRALQQQAQQQAAQGGAVPPASPPPPENNPQKQAAP